jgi:hypothetical protein
VRGAFVGAGIVLAIYVLVWLAFRRGGPLEGAFNPASDKNLAYGGVNAAGAAITGNPDYNFGAALFELLSPGALAAERRAIYGDGGPDRDATAGIGSIWLGSSGWPEGGNVALPRAAGGAIIEGPGGAAFGLYPRP